MKECKIIYLRKNKLIVSTFVILEQISCKNDLSDMNTGIEEKNYKLNKIKQNTK